MSEGAAVAAARKEGRKLSRAKIPERKARAFRAYIDVMDTAAWFRYQVEPQLADFDLNMERFRLLELLYREGPMTTTAVARSRGCARQSLGELAERLAADGLLEVERRTVCAVDEDKDEEQNQRGKGWRASTLLLTEKGETLMRGVMRRHGKLIYALMCAIDPRDMDRLSRTCRRIREGDVVKLIKELMMEDE